MNINRISGIICELNPLHNGHAALLAHTRAGSDAVVCVMSGNFVQRGDAAALDKWTRARLALQCGADLVLELPLPWAMAGAERFALGGVALLDALRADALYFGSEAGSVEPLQRIAEYLLSPAFQDDVRPLLAQGMGFAAARGGAIERALGAEASALNEKANNILGIEYLKAIRMLGAVLEPHTLRRISVEHDAPETENGFASASQIRALSAAGAPYSAYVPEATHNAVETLRSAGQYPASLRYLERGMLAFLSTAAPDALRRVPDVSEGLENRLCAAAKTVGTLEALYDAAKTKRYSHARIRRVALAAYLGLDDTLPALPPYLRVLGMNARGTALLRGNFVLPLVLRPADLAKCGTDARRVFELEARADDFYSLCTETRRPTGLDYTQPIIKQ